VSDVTVSAKTVSQHQGSECHRVVVELLDALIKRDHGYIVNAESDHELHRLQGAIRRLQEFRKLIHLTA
jgi:hypothetical protein